MNYLQHLLDSKGGANLVSRAAMICRRFGFTGKKSRRALEEILEITEKHGYTPSFFITADLLDHHGDLIRKITKNRTHVGLHGHHHIDHARISGGIQRREIARGLEKFKACDIPVSGFRSPFLRFNDETAKAVADNDMSWVSHSVMLLDHNPHSASLGKNMGVRHLLEDFYVQQMHRETPSLPCWGPDCLEIPVSLPDDELLIDRIGIREPKELTAIWSEMLDVTRQEGELCNLLFHPERSAFVGKALDAVLEKATSCGDVWVTSLDDIARWWQERASGSFEIKEGGPGTYEVTARCSPRTSVVLQHPGGEMEFIKLGKNGFFEVHSTVKPVIGISPGFCDEHARCLTNDGFVVENHGDLSHCAFTLEGTCSKNRRHVLEVVKQAREPLLRFWRWPDQYRSALAITADVDAITLMDFVRRGYHFLRTPIDS